MSQQLPRNPFNDRKHIPTRPEIDLSLGVLCAIHLKDFEHRLTVITSDINWAMYWYNPTDGWVYRASYKNSVLCILHFYRRSFGVTLSIPLDKEKDFFELRELTQEMKLQFRQSTLSPGSKWISLRVSQKDDVAGVVAVVKKKISLIKTKEEKKQRRELSKQK